MVEDKLLLRREGSPMERFIHNQNLKLYNQKLADPNTGEAERETIRKLLAEEEAREAPVAAAPQTRSPNQ